MQRERLIGKMEASLSGCLTSSFLAMNFSFFFLLSASNNAQFLALNFIPHFPFLSHSISVFPDFNQLFCYAQIHLRFHHCCVYWALHSFFNGKFFEFCLFGSYYPPVCSLRKCWKSAYGEKWNILLLSTFVLLFQIPTNI